MVTEWYRFLPGFIMHFISAVRKTQYTKGGKRKKGSWVGTERNEKGWEIDQKIYYGYFFSHTLTTDIFPFVSAVMEEQAACAMWLTKSPITIKHNVRVCVLMSSRYSWWFQRGNQNDAEQGLMWKQWLAHTCAQMHACTHTLSNTCLIVIAFQDTLDSYQLGYTATPFDDSVTVVPDGKNGTWQRVCICVCGWNELFNIRPCKCMEMNNFLISWCYLKVFLFFIFAVSVLLHFSIGVINFKLLCVCM